jgi:hypothetical protein
VDKRLIADAVSGGGGLEFVEERRREPEGDRDLGVRAPGPRRMVEGFTGTVGVLTGLVVSGAFGVVFA